jgi:hypothetical protein
MQVVTIESRSLTQLENQIRDGVIKAYRLLEGEPGQRNFALKLVNIEGEFNSPRHRHNFDQVRFQIEGTFDYSADGKLKPGWVGYFPEGTRYGPQKSSGSTWNLLLQVGGASGSGYTSESEEDRAAGELKAKGGKFEGGVYTYFRPDGTKVNQDGYEALWEHIHGRPLIYPKERFERPVLMNSENFNWVPDLQQPGVSSKFIGSFSESQLKIAFHRGEARAKLRLEPDGFYFVLNGAGEAGGKAFARHSTIHLQPQDECTASFTETTELLQLGMPRVPAQKLN